MSRKAQTVHAPTNGWRPGLTPATLHGHGFWAIMRRDSTHNTISVGGSTMSILAWIIFGGLAGLVVSLLPGGVAACGRALCGLSCIEGSGSGTIAALSHMSPATRPGNDSYLPRRRNPHPPPPNTTNNTTIRIIQPVVLI